MSIETRKILANIIKIRDADYLHQFILHNNEYDYSIPIEREMTPLMYAIHLDFMEGVEMISKQDSKKENMVMRGVFANRTAMGFAIVGKDAIKMIDILLKEGASLRNLTLQLKALDTITVGQPRDHIKQSEIITHLVDRMPLDALKTMKHHIGTWDIDFRNIVTTAWKKQENTYDLKIKMMSRCLRHKGIEPAIISDIIDQCVNDKPVLDISKQNIHSFVNKLMEASETMDERHQQGSSRQNIQDFENQSTEIEPMWSMHLPDM